MNTFIEKFEQTFITEDRYKLFLEGAKNTLLITLIAAIAGILIGSLVAIIRTSAGKAKKGTLGGAILKVLDCISGFYLTITRGTPTTVQLMIMYYIIMVSSTNKILVAIITFALNSGAYVAEIVRSGIMSVDKGQMEAGRSLGFGFAGTMWYIIIPQAFRNVLPALVNEFITLLKETSICGYIAMQDLTSAGNIVMSRTYDAFFPLISVALIYLGLVMLLTAFMGKLERRLHNNAK